MTKTYLDSSRLQSIGYDERFETLEIEFRNGAVYQYYDCPKLIYDELMSAPSKGMFFDERIRDRFPYSRV